MAGINFLSENLFKTGTKTLTTGTENAQFPLSNLDNDSPSVKFRSSGNTVVIEVDLGQTRDIDTLMVVGDPTGTFGMTTVTYKTSTTNDFSLSPVNNVTLDPEQNMGYSYITLVSHRFVEISFTGQGSYAEVGNIFIGERINITQNNLSISSFNYLYNDNSTVTENDYGQHFITSRNLQKVLAGTIEFATKSEQEILDNLFITHGRSYPLWMIVDKDGDAVNRGETKFTIYGYLTQMPIWSASGGQTYNASVRIKEAI